MDVWFSGPVAGWEQSTIVIYVVFLPVFFVYEIIKSLLFIFVLVSLIIINKPRII